MNLKTLQDKIEVELRAELYKKYSELLNYGTWNESYLKFVSKFRANPYTYHLQTKFSQETLNLKPDGV